jgi:hypothetical protein
MFNKINKVNTSIFIAAAVFLSSCEKDLLNTVPNDRLSYELFW